VLVVIVIAVLVVLAAVVFLAMGRGGGLSAERNDYVPLDLGPVTATDVALLRPPTGLWGYNMQATDEAMEQIAESIRERDVRIVALEQLVTDLSRDSGPVQLLGGPYGGARHPRAPLDPTEAGTETEIVSPDAPTAQPVRSAFEPLRPSGDFPTEPDRSPFEPLSPSGDLPGPPEQSHD
jgi:hypothetical protein